MRVIWRKDEEKKVLVPHIEQARCCKEFMGYVGGRDLVCSQCGTKIRLVEEGEEVIEVMRPTLIPPEGRVKDSRFLFY